MNYLTGLALGISAGKQFGKLYRGNGFSLVHAMHGRRRYYHEKLLNNAEFAESVEEQLTDIPVLRSFKVNQTTGTVLLEYTCQDDQIDIMMQYLDEISRRPNPTDIYGKVGSDIRRSFGNLNQSIRVNTGFTFDLRTLVSLGLLAWGANKVWTLGERPSGPQMLWWAYSLLKGRNA
ncbi:HMA2 domain-containing protein [Pelosinus sp. sgz500959]|uniref:HMA2 domain-containing protein n=1 Tax=Pelosinus sp. sgz500959 TaxID=3242472 RepID=UPI003670383B